MASLVRRVLIGKPLPTDRAHHEKLPKILALPVFSSDAISSVAYASEAIMAALLITGTQHFGLTPWLSLGIVVLLAIVATSYRQTVMAYPSGGGAYIVSRDNLGEVAAMAAGAALLVDYVLTVSVSVAAGVAAIVDLFANSGRDISSVGAVVGICIACVALICIMNLRGVRESGIVFAFPTYSFIAIMYLLIGLGIYKIIVLHGLQPIHSITDFQSARIGNEATHQLEHLRPLGTFLLLHAFANGCTALTGVEAISNGVPAFRDPASKNAATTMMWMAIILGSMFMGLSYIAIHVNALPPNAQLPGMDKVLNETVLSQVGRAIFGAGFLYKFLQIATALILVLAANTSFADFPRLSAIMSRDGFMPRPFSNIGDKLVFNNGITVLALLSAILLIAFKGSVDSLIPLYAIGVFLSFTLSQAGMVRRWFTLKTKGWQMKAIINGTGSVCTLVVMIVFGSVKFKEGAWLVIILTPILMGMFYLIHKHYRSVANQLSLEGYRPAQGLRHHVLVLVPDIHRGTIPALQYARSISEDARAVHVSIDPARENRLRERWRLWSRGVPLVVLDSPFRSLSQPIVDYIHRLKDLEPNCLITVVVPEFVPRGFWAKLLHGQAGVLLLLKLRFLEGVVVINIPYHIRAMVKLPKHVVDLSNHDIASHDGAANHHAAPAH